MRSREGASAEVRHLWLEVPQPQDLLITLLADNARHRMPRVWSGGVVKLLGELGFSAGAARIALARLVRRRLIEREKSGRVVYYRLTDTMEELLAEGDKRIFTLGESDRNTDTATILFHSLPEELRVERGRLARRLRFLQFGIVQDGIWAGVGDRREDLLAELDRFGIAGHCSIVVGEWIEEGGLRSLLDRAWDLPALAERYRRFAEMFGPFAERGVPDDQSAFLVRTQLTHNFRQFLSFDPGVTRRLWSAPPERGVSVTIFGRLYRELESAALRYFAEVTDSVSAGVR